MTRLIKFGAAGLLALCMLIAALAFLLVATPAGTRFIAERARPLLPAALTFGEVGGTLLSDLEIADIRWHDDGTTVDVAKTIVAIRLRPLLQDEVRLSRLSIRDVNIRLASERSSGEPASENALPVVDVPFSVIVEELTLSGLNIESGDFQRRIEEVSAAAAIEGSDLTIDRIVVESEWLSANANGQAQLKEDYPTSLAIAWKLRPDSGDAFSGSGRLHGDRLSLAVEHDLTAPYIIHSQGELGFEDVLSFDLTNTWTDLVLGFDNERQVSSPTGELRLAGITTDYRFTVDARATMSPVGAIELRADGTGNLESVQITTAELVTDDGRAKIDGVAKIAADTASWDVRLLAEGLDLGVLDSDLQGHLNLDLRTIGNVSDWEQLEASAEIDALSGDLYGKPLAGQGSVAITNKEIRVTRLLLNAGDNRLTADGIVGDRIDMRIRLDAPQLETISPQLSGSVKGAIALSGRRASPGIEATIEGQDLAFGQWRTGVLQARLDGTLAKHAGTIVVEQFESAAELGISGGFDGESWTGQLDDAEITLPDQERWVSRAPAGLTVSADMQRLDEICLVSGKDKSLCAQMEGAGGTLNARATLESFPVGPIIEARLPQLEARGRVTAQASLSRIDGDLNGELGANLANLSLKLRGKPASANSGPTPASDAVEMSIALNGTIENNRLAARTLLGVGEQGADGTGQADIAIADVRDRDSDLSADAQLSLPDVAFLTLFIPSASVEGGSLDGGMTVAGSVAAPEISGSARVSGASLAIPALGTQFSDLQLEIAPLDSGGIAFNGSMTSGGGSLSLQGTTRAEAGWPTEMTVAGNNVELIRLPDWTTSASPDLVIRMTTNSASVRGTVIVPQAAIVLDKLPETAESPSPDTIVHRADVLSQDEIFSYDVEVTVILENRVRLTGFGLDTKIVGGLRLDGAHNRAFRGFGSFNLIDGRFESYGQSLEIERGQLIFTGALENPLLDFRATRRIGEVSVGITMSGPANSPSSRLFSSPAMSDASTLSYLITGRPIEQTDEAESDQLAGAAISLGLYQASSVVAEISATLGLDELGFEGGSTDGRVLAGKRLGDNLYLRYAFGVFDNVGSLLLRYRLSDRLVFESESGASQSLDLIYSVSKE